MIGQLCEKNYQVWIERENRKKAEALTPAATLSKGKGVDRNQDEDPKVASLSYAQVDLSITSLDESKSYAGSHHYHANILESSNGTKTRQRGGIIHLAKELAVLSTALPAGIYLRVDEERIDVLKCLITGPEGTPYSNGLFEFDILIPLDYPNSPPLVNFQTTGGGENFCFSFSKI